MTKKNPTATIVALMQESDDIAFGERTHDWDESSIKEHLANRVQQDELTASQQQHVLDEMFPERINGKLYENRCSYDPLDY